jgi:hypothetical protein
MLQPYLLTAAIISSTLLLTGMLATIFSWDDAVIPFRGWPLWVGGSLLGASGAVSALFLWRCMASYWWQVDRREHGVSVFWLVALSVGNWVGATVYYFFVFRRDHREAVGGNSF